LSISGAARRLSGRNKFIIKKRTMSEFVNTFKTQLQLYKLVYNHQDTPILSKALLGAAIGYLCMPFDLIPDCIPILGQIDDLIIVPILIALAYWSVPKHIISKCQFEMKNQLCGSLETSDTSLQ